MNIELISTIAASLGGLELIKYLHNRRSESRSARARAEADEFRSLREYNEFLQASLKAQTEQYYEQTALVRQLNSRLHELAVEKGRAEATLAATRCEVASCPNRRPPLSADPLSAAAPEAASL